MNFIHYQRGFTGVAKTGVALFSILVMLTFFIQYIIPALAVPFDTRLVTVNPNAPIQNGVGEYNLSYNYFANITFNISATHISQNLNITLVNITIPTGFTFISASNTTNGTANHTFYNFGRNLTWNTSIGDVALVADNDTTRFSFNVSVNRTLGNYTFFVTTMDNASVQNQSNFTFQINDNVAPVLNFSTTLKNTTYTNNLTSTMFRVNMTEDNPGSAVGSENVTLSIRRFGPSGSGALKLINIPCLYGSSSIPMWQCNTTVNLESNLSAVDGDNIGYWFNTTDAAANTGVNGTPGANLSIIIDTTKPLVEGATKNKTSDLNSSHRLNVSVNVTDTNRNSTAVFVSGNTGATNITMNYTIGATNSLFEGSITPTEVGCSLNAVCTFTFYAVDYAGNINSTTLTALVDNVPPNVTTPSINDTDNIVRGNQVFNLSVIIGENFNISNVTFYNISVLGGTNSSAGNWTIIASADDFGCTENEATCTININATDNATNLNNSIPLIINVDDITPNVTLVSPGNGFNFSNASARNFNVSVRERNAGIGKVQITPAGQGAINYTLTNVSGVWGYTNDSMPDGVYTALFFINDSVGNTNASVTTTFTLDTTRPAVSSSSANDTIVRSSQIIQVNVTVTDTNRNDGNVNVTGGFNSSMSKLSGYANIFQTNSTFTAASTGCTVNANCTLVFGAADVALNLNSSHNISIVVDDVPPNVTVSGPANATVGSSVSFNATVNEDNPQNTSENLVQITPLSTTHAAYNRSLLNITGVWGYTNASMPDGAYRAQFFLYDAAGNANVSVNRTFTVDTVSPVLNTTTPSSNGTITNPNSVLFQIKLVEQNINQNINVTVHFKRQGFGGANSFTAGILNCLPTNDNPNPPHWVCNNTFDLASNISLGAGDKLEFFFNTTSANDQAQSATNGTPTAPWTATLDSGLPDVTNPTINRTGSAKSTHQFNISAIVTDAGTGISQVVASGNLGGTNVSLQATGNDNYNVSTNGSQLGCATNAAVCTIVFYANDTAGNINYTTNTSIFIDDVVPNVSSASSNITFLSSIGSPLVRSTTFFRIHTIILEANITNVTFGNGTRLGGTNTSNGNWTLNLSAQTIACPYNNGVQNNCLINITATDNATNENASAFINITVDDIPPNVTLYNTIPGNISNTTLNFNVSVLEPNPVSCVNCSIVLISQGAANTNYSLTNASGIWGYTNTSSAEGVMTVTFFVNDTLNNRNGSASFSVSIDRTAPAVSQPPVINISTDKNSTTMFNLTVNVTDTNRNDSAIFASGNDGATNVTLNLSTPSLFTGVTNGQTLGCTSNAVCTITVYARDAAGNQNSSNTTVIIDNVPPNVTNPSTNITTFTIQGSPLVRSTTVFKMEVIVSDLFNMSNVTFGNGTAIGATNTSTGNWSANISASTVRCPSLNGTLNNCNINITATDSAGNVNSTTIINITVDDIAPNVTITSPANDTQRANRTINFNVTIVEPNPNSGILEVTPAGQGPRNYTLTNSSGVWGYTNTSMPDGTYVARFLFNDTLDNRNHSVNITFTISFDNTSATGAITKIVPNVTYSGNTYVRQNISINFTIADTSSFTSIQAFFTNASGNFSVIANNSPTGFFLNTTSLIDGTYNVTINATDSANNTNTSIDQRTITIDNTAPILRGWDYGLNSKNVSLNFSETVDANNLSLALDLGNATINYTAQDGSSRQPLTAADTFVHLVNTTNINITLNYSLYNPLDALIDGDNKPQLDALEGSVTDIVGNPMTSVVNMDVTTMYNVTEKLDTGIWESLLLPQETTLESFTSLNNNFTVANVLKSIEGYYNYVEHHNGTGWASYNGSRPVNSLTHMNDSTNYFAYFVKKTNTQAIYVYIV